MPGVLSRPCRSRRYECKGSHDELQLDSRIHELVRQHPRLAYRRIAALLKREEFSVAFGRVYRQRRSDDLKVSETQQRNRRLGPSVNNCLGHQVERMNNSRIGASSSIGQPMGLLFWWNQQANPSGVRLECGRSC